MDIKFEDCPEVLRDRVNKSLETLPSKIIAIKKVDTTPYNDKCIVTTHYKVFLQFGYEVAIYSSDLTVGMDGGSALDNIVRIDSVNAGEMITIIEHAEWIKDELRKLF